jgi:ATP-dependent DNA helicase RecQ
MDGTPAPAELAARAWNLFRELLRYLDARTCRHDFILRYFGDEQELLGGCGHCDICVGLDERDADDGDQAEREETARIVRMALSGVARARQRAGLLAVVEMLRGVDSDKTRRFGFTGLSTFGLLKDRSPSWVMDLLRAMLTAGWIDLTPTEHPVPLLTHAGGEVMRAKGPVRFALPAEQEARVRKRAAAPRSARPDPESLDASTRERFERLRAHRAQVARSRGVPAYVVAMDRTLIEMASRGPRSHTELLQVFGMGPARVEQYGDGFLEVLRAR